MLELRAAISLTRLWRDQGKADEDLRPGLGPGRRPSWVAACVVSELARAELGRPLGVDDHLRLRLLAEARELRSLGVQPGGREEAPVTAFGIALRATRSAKRAGCACPFRYRI